MITELIFDILFTIPSYFLRFLAPIGSELFNGFGNLTAVVELLSIASAFFPIGLLVRYLSVWLALTMFTLVKQFVEWLYKLIPLT